MRVSNLLVTRFSALGDVAMTVPALYSLCRTNPGMRVLFVTKPLAATIFVNTPENLTVIPFEPGRWRGLRGLWRFGSWLRRQYEVDAYADLHDVIRSKVLRLHMRLHGVKVRRLRKGRRGKRALTRPRNKVMLPLVTSRARYREVFWRMGLRREDLFDNLFTADTPPDRSLYASVARPRAGKASDGETWVAVAPFAAHEGKVYPPDLMSRVVATLAARPGTRLFLFGAGGEEERLLSGWERRHPGVAVDMAARHLGLPAELALLHDCDAMISMDSANMHLASLVGLPVVSVWGATHPYCGFLGWRQRKGDAVQLDMVCRPCSVFGDRPCRRSDLHCMRGIQPAHVVRKLDHVLARRNWE